MPFEKGIQKPEGSGRKPGVTNKATTEAREAIARFVDGNAGRLQGWLDAIATGMDEKGNKIGEPNPVKAYELFQGIIEYHVPKLARSEINAKITTYETLVIKEADSGD